MSLFFYRSSFLPFQLQIVPGSTPQVAVEEPVTPIISNAPRQNKPTPIPILQVESRDRMGSMEEVKVEVQEKPYVFTNLHRRSTLLAQVRQKNK